MCQNLAQFPYLHKTFPWSLKPRMIYLSKIALSLSTSLDLLSYYPNPYYHNISPRLPCGDGFVAQLYLTLWDPMHCCPPGSLVHAISQARILEWVVIFFSKRSSLPSNWIHVSCIVDRFFTDWVNREARDHHKHHLPECIAFTLSSFTLICFLFFFFQNNLFKLCHPPCIHILVVSHEDLLI